MNESDLQQPDFSGGEAFLSDLRVRLRRQQLRRRAVSSIAASAAAVLLFALSFSALQRQADEALWESYLSEQIAQEVAAEQLDDFSWDLYLESLLQENDLDMLLDAIISLEEGEKWIETLQLKG